MRESLKLKSHNRSLSFVSLLTYFHHMHFYGDVGVDTNLSNISLWCRKRVNLTRVPYLVPRKTINDHRVLCLSRSNKQRGTTETIGLYLRYCTIIINQGRHNNSSYWS